MKNSRLLVSSLAAVSLLGVSACVTDPNTGEKKVSRTAMGGLGGTVLGGLLGGKKGAVVGTIVGGGAGTGVVLATRGDEVALASGTALTTTLTRPVVVQVLVR